MNFVLPRALGVTRINAQEKNLETQIQFPRVVKNVTVSISVTNKPRKSVNSFL